MNEQHVYEYLEAYALGALDADERVRVELHLTTCDDCMRVAQEYALIAPALPSALAVASATRLPAALRNRVLQSLETPAHENIAPHARNLLAWFNPRAVAIIAAFVIALLSFVWGQEQSVALARERALRAEYASLVSQQELVLDVIDSNKTTLVALRATTEGSPWYGKLYSRSDLPYVVVMSARLPAPALGQAYYLWLTAQGKTQLAGVMKLSEQGFGIVIYQADRNGPTFDAAQLILQPDGSTAPSENPILAWKNSK